MSIVVLTLPDDMSQRAQSAARTLQWPLEELLLTLLESALPDMAGVPDAMQEEVTRMAWLDDQALWGIAQASLPEADTQRLRDLSARASHLSPTEQAQLKQLRQDYGRITLCKARAYALLSLRGGQPLLAAAP